MFSDAELDHINTSHLIDQTALCRADLGFVFGNRHIWRQLADEAFDLYTQGYFDRIIVSGGVRTDIGATEADAMAARLYTLGVPKEDVLIERRSRHTGENVALSLPVIDRALGLENIRSVIGLGHFSAGPRFLMTLARWWPEAHSMHRSVYPLGHDAGNWHEHPGLCDKVRCEIAKLPLYLETGFILPIDRDTIDQRALLKSGAYRHPASDYKADRGLAFQP